MIDDPRGSIDYDEYGEGATVVLVPGTCSTGAAWRPMMATWGGRFRCVTTSLLGYGGTAERRTADDPDMLHQAEALEAVIRKAGGRAHVVGHSFGGLVALAVALRRKVDLASLVIVEAPAAEVLRDRSEYEHYTAFRRMTDAYLASFKAGDEEAIAQVIDFYGGAGTYASWPPKLRAYTMETTAVNILDWATVFAYPIPAAALAALDLPVLVMHGGDSHPAAKRANALLSEGVPGARLAIVDGADHFMIATHAGEVGQLVADHVTALEAAHA